MTNTTQTRISDEAARRMTREYQRALAADATESERAAGIRAEMILSRTEYSHHIDHASHMRLLAESLCGEHDIPACETILPDGDWMSLLLS